MFENGVSGEDDLGALLVACGGAIMTVAIGLAVLIANTTMQPSFILVGS